MDNRELDKIIAEKPYKCRRCGGTEFKRRPVEGHRYCPTCKAFLAKKRHDANKDQINTRRRALKYFSSPKFKHYQRSWQLKRRYGISSAEYDALLTAQGGVCAICRELPAEGRRLCVDHAHKTGEVRGLLCDSCNNGIARFKDSINLLGEAIVYLSR